MYLNPLVLLPVAGLQLIREAGNAGGSVALSQGPDKRLADNERPVVWKMQLKKQYKYGCPGG